MSHSISLDSLRRVRSEPHIINISPKRGPIDGEYEIGLSANKVRCYAPSLGAARQKALEHFRPKKKDRTLIWAKAVA
ncbi:hypothetical protein [Roseococcus sp.]|uniref:hypothetical protein n=1 Tax=Roseococcus sp. TaxID=2109646 RepID=UPI003BAA78BA